MTAARIALRARLVFPVASPPIDDGIVTIEGSKIVAVGENTSPAPPRDLGDVALLPGLINVHTHLEFSELRAPLGEPGMSLPDWISTVVARRRQHADLDNAVLSTARRSQAIQSGIRQCLQAGVTTVGDIVTWDVTEDNLPGTSPRYVAFRELIGLTTDRGEEQLAAARAYVTPQPSASPRFVRGLSPHAPYTVAPELVQQIATISKNRRLVVAMHLAESPEELQLLAERAGPFRDLLQRFDAWDEAALPGDMCPLDYLKLLSPSHRALIVHGNSLGSEDWAYLARHRSNMTVVYCPRTHHYFRYAPYPLGDMLRAGVRVALGTDGRGSNPDLNLLDELKFAAAQHQIDPRELLRMITLNAAESLGCEDRIGSLECGKLADLTVVPLDNAAVRDPYRALLDPATKPLRVWSGGVEQNG